MNVRRSTPLFLAALLAIAACAGKPTDPVASPSSAPHPGPLSHPSPTPQPVGGTITGLVKAPANLVENVPGQELSEVRYAGAEVFLADATGKAIAGIGHVKSDSRGSYTLRGVPAGFTFQVMAMLKQADGSSLTLRSLVTTDKDGGSADLTTTTTFVAATGTQGLTGTLGAFTVGNFKQLSTATGNALQLADLDLMSAPDKMARRLQAIANDAPEVKAGLEMLHEELAKSDTSSEELQHQVTNLAQQPSAAPTSEPSAAVVVDATPEPFQATPTPTPDAAASATAKPAATPVPGPGEGWSMVASPPQPTSVKSVLTGMKTPEHLVISRAGKVFVSGFGDHVVWTAKDDDTASAPALTFAAADVVPFPHGIVADADGNLYVSRRVSVGANDAANPNPGSEVAGTQVYKLAADGKSAQPLRYTFSTPTGLCLDADGRTLYVVNSGAGNVVAYDTETDNARVLASNLTYGNGIAQDPAGNLYVCHVRASFDDPDPKKDGWRGCITRITHDGKASLYYAGDIGITGQVAMDALIYDGADGTFWASNNWGHALYHLDGFKKQIAVYDKLTAQPSGLGKDPAGKLLVADYSLGVLLKVTW